VTARRDAGKAAAQNLPESVKEKHITRNNGLNACYGQK